MCHVPLRIRGPSELEDLMSRLPDTNMQADQGGPEEPVVYVTQPYLPPLEEFIPYLEEIWNNRVLTNNGPFHQRFERRLADFLGVNEIAAFANGTLALVVALQALRISGEVITTPYSFVATTHALRWNGIDPVFVDIDRRTLNLDPDKIEAAITPRTTAILATHVYGNPCDTEAIQKIADTYGLRVIYDGAHCFGVKRRGHSVLDAGDISILSFHATKVVNTFEGGAVVCQDSKTKQRIDFLKNFGFANEVTVTAPGINAKMSEFQAALGLLQLDHWPKIIAARRTVAEYYRERLGDHPHIELLDIPPDVEWNYAYFPILVRPSHRFSRDQLYERCRDARIFARRYFYPLISNFPSYRGLPSATQERLPIANDISRRILCLPIYPDLPRNVQDRIINVIS